MDNNAPKKIYLLCYGESHEESGEDIFWCEDRINDTDEEYYHVSEIKRLRKVIEGEIGRLKYFVDTESIKAQQGLLKALKRGE